MLDTLAYQSLHGTLDDLPLLGTSAGFYLAGFLGRSSPCLATSVGLSLLGSSTDLPAVAAFPRYLYSLAGYLPSVPTFSRKGTFLRYLSSPVTYLP